MVGDRGSAIAVGRADSKILLGRDIIARVFSLVTCRSKSYHQGRREYTKVLRTSTSEKGDGEMKYGLTFRR